MNKRMRESPMAVRQTYLPRHLMLFSPLPKDWKWAPLPFFRVPQAVLENRRAARFDL
jgi:hypothetical protein